MADELLNDMGVVADTPQVTEQVIPQVETPPAQVEAPQVQQPAQTQEVTIDEVLSLNDEVNPTATPAPVAETLTPTIEVDRGAILNELFGNSDPESIKQKLSELTRLQGEVEKPRYQSKFAEYIDNLVSKYGDPKSQADVFKKTIDVLTTDADSLDDKTALAFQMKQEYSSLTDDEIQTLLNGKYNLNDYATEEQQKLGAIQLKLDSQKAKLNIKQMQSEAFKDTPSRQVELRQVDEQKRTLEWEQKSQEVAQGINSFEFEVEKGKKMKFDIPQTDKAMLADLSKNIAVNSGIAADANGMKQIQEIVKMTYMYQNAQKLISNAYKKGLSQGNAEWAQKVHNPSGLKNSNGQFEATTNKSAEDQMVDWIADMYKR